MKNENYILFPEPPYVNANPVQNYSQWFKILDARQLMEQKKMLVTLEPELGEDFWVDVSVRHPEKGLIRRMFVSEH